MSGTQRAAETQMEPSHAPPGQSASFSQPWKHCPHGDPYHPMGHTTGIGAPQPLHLARSGVMHSVPGSQSASESQATSLSSRGWATKEPGVATAAAPVAVPGCGSGTCSMGRALHAASVMAASAIHASRPVSERAGRVLPLESLRTWCRVGGGMAQREKANVAGRAVGMVARASHHAQHRVEATAWRGPSASRHLSYARGVASVAPASGVRSWRGSSPR